MPEERRATDPMIIDMHGKLTKLLERSENHKSYLDSVSKKIETHFDGHDDDLEAVKSDLTGIKWIGSLVTVGISIIGIFWKRH